ncbi:PREDICTED: UPF0764 protein C16orf89-like [Nicrophorus vespilloides]|uniref:UPF0764 protein C16orf89-like n=1 Tax=Nicrophorus vespilloides TaxID=110193 RepID=A0ABM1MC52_NICVS|nr:PREDICTED: UPF0764 protein C16orf89-like [Nicrophorus vespilloides]
MNTYTLLVFTAFFVQNRGDYLTKTIEKLNSGLDFIESHSNEFNFDGLLGVVLAEAQLNNAKTRIKGNEKLLNILDNLSLRCARISNKIKPHLTDRSEKYQLFEKVLLRAEFWMGKIELKRNSLRDFGIYANWTRETVRENRRAEFDGIGTDFCLEELLRGCRVGNVCEQMMFADRVDTGYLLSHRLFYLMIGLNAKCFRDGETAREVIINFCSLMLKEAKTNRALGFPKRDIFMEQVLFCGMRGFDEFLNAFVLDKLFAWQNDEGCYRSEGYWNSIEIRTTNLISYNCTDHSTGLGVAALALHLVHLL